MRELQYNFFASIINNINIEILQHGYLIGDHEWKYYNINSPYNRLYFVLGGKGYVQNRQGKVDLAPGKVYLIPLHTTNDYVCNDYMEKFYLHFKSDLFAGNDIFNNIHSCIELPFNAASVNKLVKKAGNQNLSDIAWCKAFFLEIIAQFIESYIDINDKQMYILFKYQSIFNYVKNHKPFKITVNQLSEEMNMSASNLAKCFKQDTGTTLKEYINAQLVQTSKEKLLLGDSSIKEIAFGLGFTDEFYFSRFFKKQTGYSPTDYRFHNRMKYGN